ncbi:MAG: right-handed parallel beta-helix repeat-containing protein [Candidatus Bathyarchaeota archaeon]|nr:right-handed parallel beta-helix repeat-containing protein [Candidatus Bathyarchaeota archaeon]
MHNIVTDLNYTSIQEAVDAPETLPGHTIIVGSNTYNENIRINKSLTIRGMGHRSTIVNGGGLGTVVYVGVNNVSISGFTITNGGSNGLPLEENSGIFLDHCSGINLSHNSVTKSQYGIYLFHSYGNILTNNNISECYEEGVWLYHSGENLLVANQMVGNRYNFGVFGSNSPDFSNIINTTNTAEGKPVLYLADVSDTVFDERTNASCIYLIECSNVTIENLSFTGNGHGIMLWNATSSVIQNLTVSNNNYGIYLQNSAGNRVEGCYCLENWVGICLEDSSGNNVQNANLWNNEKGLSLYKAHNNTISGCTSRANLYGIRLFASSLNTAHHNNLVENKYQVHLINSPLNYWNSRSAGNYWSDYIERYPNSSYDEFNILSMAYVLDRSNQDSFPLRNLFWASADVDHDLDVDTSDVSYAYHAYASEASEPNWNIYCDVAQPYGVIDIFDIVTIARSFGEKQTST